MPDTNMVVLIRMAISYGAGLGGVGEAADAWNALAGACAEEDELRLLKPLSRLRISCRAAERRTSNAEVGARWKKNNPEK
jgi:hypothetical protein